MSTNRVYIIEGEINKLSKQKKKVDQELWKELYRRILILKKKIRLLKGKKR